MTLNSILQDSSQMSNHMAGNNSNQDLIILIALLLLLLIIILIGIVLTVGYFLYTGKIVLRRKKDALEDSVESSRSDDFTTSNENTDLPPVSLNPLERKIIEVVMNGHNVLQSDLPQLVNSSKSKVSEALSYLEEQKLVQRIKAGRSLTVKYIYKSST